MCFILLVGTLPAYGTLSYVCLGKAKKDLTGVHWNICCMGENERALDIIDIAKKGMPLYAK
jgi:hypothetical protein